MTLGNRLVIPRSSSFTAVRLRALGAALDGRVGGEDSPHRRRGDANDTVRAYLAANQSATLRVPDLMSFFIVSMSVLTVASICESKSWNGPMSTPLLLRSLTYTG